MRQVYPQPCIRCGSCCRSEICSHGGMFLGTLTPPCPALEFRDGVYCCGLIVNTSRYLYPGVVLSERLYGRIRNFLLEEFEFGVGCDSKLRCPEVGDGAAARGRGELGIPR